MDVYLSISLVSGKVRTFRLISPTSIRDHELFNSPLSLTTFYNKTPVIGTTTALPPASIPVVAGGGTEVYVDVTTETSVWVFHENDVFVAVAVAVETRHVVKVVAFEGGDSLVAGPGGQ